MNFFKRVFGGQGSERALAGERAGFVRGLPLPRRLLTLLADGEWKTPDVDRMNAALPGLKGRVEFLETEEAIAAESLEVLADHLNTARNFSVYRGSRDAEQSLPFLDVEKAVLLAVSGEAGKDLAVVLDYRGDPNSPRVVFSDWGDRSGNCEWVEAFDSFDGFADACGFGKR